MIISASTVLFKFLLNLIQKRKLHKISEQYFSYIHEKNRLNKI